MFGFKRKKSIAGPDFSQVDEQTAEQLYQEGVFEKLWLLPLEFGGADIPQNFVYVPLGLAAAKEHIDLNIIGPLISEGTVSEYSATPEYHGNSFIPIAVQIVASTPGSFQAAVNIWGPALSR